MNNTFYPANDYREYLSHGGPGSGRYPEGSGKNPFQHIGAGKSPFRSFDKEEWFRQDVKTGKDKAPVSKSEKVTRSARDIIDEASNATGRMASIERQKQSRKSDASKLSDKELNDAIRRMRLEREYNQLKASDISNGFDKVHEILAIAGSVAGIAASAATIASIFYGIKNPKIESPKK